MDYGEAAPQQLKAPTLQLMGGNVFSLYECLQAGTIRDPREFFSEQEAAWPFCGPNSGLSFTDTRVQTGLPAFWVGAVREKKDRSQTQTGDIAIKHA